MGAAHDVGADRSRPQFSEQSRHLVASHCRQAEARRHRSSGRSEADDHVSPRAGGHLRSKDARGCSPRNRRVLLEAHSCRTGRLGTSRTIRTAARAAHGGGDSRAARQLCECRKSPARESRIAPPRTRSASRARHEPSSAGSTGHDGKPRALDDRCACLVVVFAWMGTEALLRLVSEDGSRAPVAVETDFRLMAFVALVSVATAILFGSVPAWRSLRASLVTSLAARRGSVDPSNQRVGSLLVVAQVAVSLVLVMGAGLFLRTLTNLRSVDLGFVPERLVDSQRQSSNGRISCRPGGCPHRALVGTAEVRAWRERRQFLRQRCHVRSRQSHQSHPARRDSSPAKRATRESRLTSLGRTIFRRWGFHLRRVAILPSATISWCLP